MSKADILLRKLQSKTSEFLRQIATKCGINSSGTKPILLNRLVHDLQTPLLRPLPPATPHRILSIDMGIRNLALCSLSTPSQSGIPPVPRIDSWSRVTVSAKSTTGGETFEPSDYAKKAYELMKTSLDMYRPHTVLIERQRYRSGGGAAVQEWTVRVNMLESMFHAVLHTLSQTSSSLSMPFFSASNLSEFEVYSVSPKKVTQLWVQEEGRLTARETKVKKIAMAKRIVEGEEVKVEFMGQAKEAAERFNARGQGKADDLADSMLQGLGWWRWHVNREEMVKKILSWEDVVKEVKEKKIKKGKDDVETKTRRRKLKKEEPEKENAAMDDLTIQSMDIPIQVPASEIVLSLSPRKSKTSTKSIKITTKRGNPDTCIKIDTTKTPHYLSPPM